MSDSQAYEEVNLASDGVRVVKRFEEDEFPVPAIAFEFMSDREEEVTVRLSDTVPEGIEVEDLGFHPEYGSEYWTIDEETITFERSLDANSSYTTVYGIRATGSDDVEQFLTEPTVKSVDPPLPEAEEGDEDVIPEGGDNVVKDAISGDGEIPGLEDEEGDKEDEDVETLNLKDPNEPESGRTQTRTDGQEVESESESTDSTETTQTEGSSEVSVDGSVVAAMANEIRQKNVSAEDVKLLRRAFEIAGEDGGTTAAKIQQIQTDIADLRAYTSSLEEFLEDNGTAEEIINSFEEQIDRFDSQLGELRSEIHSNSSELSSVSEEVDSMSSEVDSMSGEVDSVSEQLDSVTSEVDTVGDEVDSVSQEVDSLGDEVDTVGQEVGSVNEEMESLRDEVSQFESAIGEVESEINRLEDEVTDIDVAERLETLGEELNELQEWQDQIKETFGG